MTMSGADHVDANFGWDVIFKPAEALFTVADNDKRLSEQQHESNSNEPTYFPSNTKDIESVSQIAKEWSTLKNELELAKADLRVLILWHASIPPHQSE
jgi:hypothetical protein